MPTHNIYRRPTDVIPMLAATIGSLANMSMGANLAAMAMERFNRGGGKGRSKKGSCMGTHHATQARRMAKSRVARRYRAINRQWAKGAI